MIAVFLNLGNSIVSHQHCNVKSFHINASNTWKTDLLFPLCKLGSFFSLFTSRWVMMSWLLLNLLDASCLRGESPLWRHVGSSLFDLIVWLIINCINMYKATRLFAFWARYQIFYALCKIWATFIWLFTEDSWNKKLVGRSKSSCTTL